MNFTVTLRAEEEDPQAAEISGSPVSDWSAFVAGGAVMGRGRASSTFDDDWVGNMLNACDMP